MPHSIGQKLGVRESVLLESSMAARGIKNICQLSLVHTVWTTIVATPGRNALNGVAHDTSGSKT